MTRSPQPKAMAYWSILLLGPVILLVVVSTDIKQYIIFSQAVEYRSLYLGLSSCSVEHSLYFDNTATWDETEPNRYFARYLYWFPRYSVTIPAFEICEKWGVDADTAFSLTVVLMCAGTIFFTSMAFAGKESGPVFALTVSIFFLLVFLLMNGRVSFAFAGFSLLLWSFKSLLDIKPALRTILAVSAGLYLSLVSSGTFFVSFLLFSCYLPAMFKNASTLYVRLALVVLTIMGVYLLICAVVFLAQFYGGLIQTLYGVFTHGILQYFPVEYATPVAAVTIFMIIALGFAVKAMLSKRKLFNREHKLQYLALGLPMIGTVFGISAGSLLLVSLGGLAARGTEHFPRICRFRLSGS